MGCGNDDIGLVIVLTTKQLSLLPKYLLCCCLFVVYPQLIITTTWNLVPVPVDSRGDLLGT